MYNCEQVNKWTGVSEQWSVVSGQWSSFANIKIKSSEFTNCKKKVDSEDFLYLCESNIIKSHSDFLNCTL